MKWLRFFALALVLVTGLGLFGMAQIGIQLSASARAICEATFSHELEVSWNVTGVRGSVQVTITVTGPDGRSQSFTQNTPQGSLKVPLNYPGGGSVQVQLTARTDSAMATGSASASLSACPAANPLQEASSLMARAIDVSSLERSELNVPLILSTPFGTVTRKAPVSFTHVKGVSVTLEAPATFTSTSRAGHREYAFKGWLSEDGKTLSSENKLSLQLEGMRTVFAAYCAGTCQVNPPNCGSGRVPTVIDFETLPDGSATTDKQEIFADYSRLGVTFSDAPTIVSPAKGTHSGLRALQQRQELNTEFNTTPLVMQFAPAQKRVKLYVGLPVASSAQATLKAFNSAGALLTPVNPATTSAELGPGPTPITTPLEFETGDYEISRLEYQLKADSGEVIDDLEFESPCQPVATDTQPPTVTINMPPDGSTLVDSHTEVLGTVESKAVRPRTTLTHQWNVRPGSTTTSSLSRSVGLSGDAPSLAFDMPLDLVLGPNTITVEASNGAGTGQATVHVTYMPSEISDKYQASGGEPALGAFVYGKVMTYGCLYAIYEKGAVALWNGEAFVVAGEIFRKWTSLFTDADPLGPLGCPTADEKPFDLPPGEKSQDFEHGRIFTGPEYGTHVLLQPFLDVWDKLGGGQGIGFPVTDLEETTVVGPELVWQQFQRPDFGSLIEKSPPSVMEMVPCTSGPCSSTVWVARAGDPDQFRDAGQKITERTATRWLAVPCDSDKGPCHIPPTPNPPRLRNANLKCDGGIAIEDSFDLTQHEWVPVIDDETLTKVEGVVTKSQFTSDDGILALFVGPDNPLNHGDGLPPLDAAETDWIINILPDPEYQGLLTEGNGHPGILHTEIENYQFVNPIVLAGLDSPEPGDLIIEIGRWIIDCGHHNFKGEIHPPAIIVWKYTKLEKGTPKTYADTYINGSYSGGVAEWDIYPPARPSPDARLVWAKPTDAINGDISFEVQELPADNPNHIHVKVTATPYRKPQVGHGTFDKGQIFFPPGRGYAAFWRVWWQNR